MAQTRFQKRRRWLLQCCFLLPVILLGGCGSDFSLSPAELEAESIFDSEMNASTVFLGDSITYFWKLPLHNAGIGGNRTGDMLSRFQTDVLGHGYKRVVILGGTNDIWSQEVSLDRVAVNISSMAEMAKDAGMDVVLCTIPPLTPVTPANVNFTPAVTAVNAQIKQVAEQGGYRLVDYYPSLVGRREYFIDGVHPNSIGYARMQAVMAVAVTE